ncbi:MAG: T9SS C-terminal target domain-containing protein, partial [Calditrichaeota bacterium]
SLTHVATVTATANFWGLDIPVIFTAVDDSGGVDQDTTTITVEPVNDPPVIGGPLPELFFAEDDTLLYALSNWYPFVSDPDQPVDQLSYVVLPGRNVSARQVGNAYRFTAAANWFGRDTLQLVVSDSLASDTAALYVNVASVNDPPVISGLPDSVVFRADSSVTLNIWDYVEDVETPDSLLQYQFGVSNDSLLRNYNPATGQLTLSAVSQFHGAVVLTITVTDDSSAVAEDSLLVIVEPVMGIDPFAGMIPDRYVLLQNYPNPFNPVTRIRFGLPKPSRVTLEVYNILGQRVATLIDGKQLSAGYHLAQFDGSAFASGVYLYRIQAGRFVQVRKMLLMK